jgi:glucosamine 6-phosphate synthetase-like amidotransferase/phosphosugar isomerase protein
VCGLFGLVRPAGADGRATAAVFSELGRLAMERGRDASGWATLADPRSTRWRTVKAPMPFRSLWATRSRSEDRALLSARAAMGHARAASQGAVRRMANCSPMAAGDILGTHNGDTDAADLARRFGIDGRRLAGETDTEVLLSALGLAPARQVLEAVAGRVALVWADSRRPGRLFLARGAWSPLYVAQASDGVLWWASSPSWLETAGVDAPQVYRLSEGTLLEVDLAKARFVRSRRFVPTARQRDDWAARYAYAGIDQAEAAEDMARHCHRVRQAAAAWRAPWRPVASQARFVVA